MHDPSTVAFEIKYPWWRTLRAFPYNKGNHVRHHDTFVTVWHEDPETDRTDDSCGWFLRARHGDPKVLQRIVSDLTFNWDAEYGGYFDKDGHPILSVSGIVLDWVRVAARAHFEGPERQNASGRAARKAYRFVQRHLAEILHLAENTLDSLHPMITGKYGIERREQRIEQAAALIYGWVLRQQRPWYRHPRWHVWHWRLQVHPVQKFKRWAFTRCMTCGGRFKWGEAPCAGWSGGDGPAWFRNGERVWHCGRCDTSTKVPLDEQPRFSNNVTSDGPRVPRG